jgi:hypothetical protein
VRDCKEKSATEWTLSATEDEEIAWEIMVICPFAERNLQQRRLHEQSQPLQQLDEVIE